jgi:predicted MFS family arabinose efflux permease
LLYQLVPENYRGRVFAVEIAVFTLGSAISGAIGGWLLDTTPVGVSGLMWLMAAAGLIPALLWSAWMRIASRRRAVPVATGEGEEWKPLE